jgi:hypothetical protein
MSVFAVDDLTSAFEGATRPGFWRRLARTLDAGFANRSKQGMPVDAFRRSRRDIERCRRLLRSSVRLPAGPHAVLAAPRR